MISKHHLLSHLAVFLSGAGLIFLFRDSVSSEVKNENLASTSGKASSYRSAERMTEEKTNDNRRKRTGMTPSIRGSAAVSARLTMILNMGNPFDRQAALFDLVGKLGSTELATLAAEYAKSNHFSDSGGELEIIMRGWTKQDPLGALEFAQNTLKSGAQSAVVLAAWAGQDPTAAQNWAIANHQGDGANPYLAAVIRGLAPHDLDAAAKLVQSMPASRERATALNSIVQALMMKGIDTALAFPSRVSDPELRARYVGIISDQLLQRDPQQAADWVANLTDVNAQKQAGRKIAETLANQSVELAAKWVKKLAPAAQAEAASGLIIPMSNADIPGTAKWVASLAGTPNYDRVVEEFVWSCDVRDPEQSAAWISAISNQEQKTRLFHRMIGDWARRDETGAKKWIASNPVPQSITQRFLGQTPAPR